MRWRGRGGLRAGITRRRNLADPDYEPSDEELMRRAFEGVAEAHEQVLREMFERIAARRDEAQPPREPEAGEA